MAVKAPGFGDRRKAMLQDMAILTGGTVISETVGLKLENATLEVGKVGKDYALLNCDDHKSFLQRHRRDVSLYRPDICHQALLAILDSPLNKAGRVSGVYVRTAKNVLIEVNTKIRLPRTFKRFSGLMLQLLQKLSIRATNGSEKLMRVIKGPVTKHLPVGSLRVGFSFSAPQIRPLKKLVASLEPDRKVVFVVGAISHGKIETPYVDEMISVSQFPLSAAQCLGRITNAMEDKYDIV